MAYTIGASHGPFTGNGSFAVSKPTGIRTVVTGIPFYTGHDGSIPRRYFRLGRFTMGNADGFQFSHGLEYVQQLLYPMPPVWEILAYDVKDGASCLFQELVDVPDLSLKQPWDRAPSPVAINGSGYLTAGAAPTTMLTYTVPAGRRLRLEALTLQVTTIAVPTNVAFIELAAKRGGLICGYLISWQQLVGQRETSQPLGAALHFSPGEVITVTGYDGHAGGGVYASAALSGFLFDA